MYKIVILLFASLSMLIGFNANAKEIFLACKVITPNNVYKSYTFSFDESKNTLYLVDSSQQMKVLRNNDTQLWASQTEKIYRDFNYDYLTFYLNRITGEAEISYAIQPSEKEITECKNNPEIKNKKWPCESYPVLTEKTEQGSCEIVKRKI
jgi:hypothetical protein